MNEGEGRTVSDSLSLTVLLDRLGESIPGLVYVYDVVEGRNVFTNRPVAELLGYSPEEVRALGDRALSEILHPEGMAAALAHHEKMREAADGQVIEVEYRVRAADGGWRWLHAWESVLTRDPSGQARQLLGIAQDVTQRYRAEEELRESQRLLSESEQRWRSIAENPFDFVVVIDRNFKFTFLNFVAPGLRREDLLGIATPFDYVAPSDHEAMRAAFDIVFNEGRPASYEVHVPSMNKWYASVIGPIRQGDVVTHASILTRDSTAEKQLQEQARRAEHELRVMEVKLAQSAKLEAVGQLAGGIAHDFNNLLTGIGGVAEILAHRLGPGDPSYADLRDLQQAVTRGSGLTRQLLSFSRQQPIAPTDIDLNVLVDDTARLLRRLIGPDVDLQVVKADAPLCVRCDRTQLEQILLNLSLNARDAMPGGGQLRVQLRQVQIAESARQDHPDARPGPCAQITVQDTGTGMDAATLARIFEPFFTTKPIGVGTGLGLAMVYGIVRQNGGFIHVRSQPGHGCTFEIHLPSCQPGAPPRREAALPQQGGDETILLVEDDAMALRLTRRLLEMLGYQVKVASRGDEALQLIEQGTTFDLLFTDVLLPGLDGYELYQRAVKLRPGLPVVFTSGYTADLLLDKGITAAGAAFLPKPFSHDELSSKVRAALAVRARSPSG